MAPPVSPHINGDSHILPKINESRKIVVLDGGFATQLSCHVDQPVDGDPLWSARFLATHPEAVINTHLDFLRAGADLIITNTYQASVGGFVEHLKMSETESLNLITKAAKLAQTALEKYLIECPDSAGRPKPLIVGSVGPYGASLHDGSEYTGSYATQVTKETMAEWHRPRIEALINAGVNLLALETIPCGLEGEMLVELLKNYPSIKAWLSFSCQDEKHIANGDDFQETAKKCYDKNPRQIIAVGVNCLAPRLVESLVGGINKDRPNNPVPLVVYPNSGENYNVELGWIDRDKCEPIDVYIKTWLDLGVSYIGGCCRTYAADISRIRNAIEKWKIQQKNY